MVKMTLALIGVYYGMVLLVCCHCFLDCALQILSANLPYTTLCFFSYRNSENHMRKQFPKT